MQSVTVKQTRRLSMGVFCATVGMLLVFYCLGELTAPVIWGALLGALVEIGNFVLLGISLQKAVADEVRGKMILKMTYNLRVFIFVAAILVGFYAPCFHIVAVVVPMVAGRLTLFILQAKELRKQTSQEEREASDTAQ